MPGEDIMDISNVVSTQGKTITVHSLLVVIPFRGLLEQLCDTVKSVRDSSGVSARIIVFDDRDGSHVRPQFLNRDEYVQTGGIGLPGVINESKNYVREELVSVVAGDDLVTPDKFRLQIESMKVQEANISFTRLRKFSKHKGYIPSLSGDCNVSLFSKILLLLGPYGADGSLLMSRDFYLKYYILHPSDSFSDWDIALSHYPDKISYINKQLFLYRQHSNQVTRNKRNDFSTSEVLSSWRKVFRENVRDAQVSDEEIFIIASPWYRRSFEKYSLHDSIVTMSDILKAYRNLSPSRGDMRCVESIILRRIIFRMNALSPREIPHLLSKLKIKLPKLKFALELIRVGIEILRSYPSKPRTH